jgi:hypothetical protein
MPVSASRDRRKNGRQKLVLRRSRREGTLGQWAVHLTCELTDHHLSLIARAPSLLGMHVRLTYFVDLILPLFDTFRVDRALHLPRLSVQRTDGDAGVCYGDRDRRWFPIGLASERFSSP